MSKSAPNPNSRILITDPPEVISKKIRGAVTDSERSLSWEPEGRRGVSNLLRILDACDPESTAVTTTTNDYDAHMSTLAARLSSQGIASHAQLKSIVADAVVEKLRGIREEYLRIRQDRAYLSSVAEEGRVRAGELARRTMVEVRKKVGMSPI